MPEFAWLQSSASMIHATRECDKDHNTDHALIIYSPAKNFGRFIVEIKRQSGDNLLTVDGRSDRNIRAMSKGIALTSLRWPLCGILLASVAGG